MKKNVLAVLFTAVGMVLSAQTKEFSKEALEDIFLTTDGQDITFSEVLEANKGKTLFIDVWASWCKDCLESIPKLAELDTKYEDVTFVFLSLDRSVEGWERGREKHRLDYGQHYFIKAGWKGSPFCKSIDLDWIPRYLVVNPEGKIELFKAIETNDTQLINTLNHTTK
ncbi:TlpA family protein disulfide reductase [Sinomicrobium weinanense]|uniref:Redoxin family protein n=1 Tax=Sinomicrobium weinanense TaxID=2842200 RepID=A0A926JTG1_9FLAO|nr:thioredoxin-like domain-containing protein [Sinomicrobium weinanense]MBC9797056.1 redoxin family protein [Sinomicrobium weinanense]MBU3122051.1 redoxin family protein [Sinomicrobium weinanense]